MKSILALCQQSEIPHKREFFYELEQSFYMTFSNLKNSNVSGAKGSFS